MIEKKPSPIATQRDRDIKHLREVQLNIIRGGMLCPKCQKENDCKISKKDVIEASKLLSRLHHALQPEKAVTAKASAQQAQQISSTKLTTEEQAEIQALIDA